ncbi:hypothetical protein X777_05700 [Ooceraea biroi]|uniref:DUF1758 domain-containing protein n=1 Tax=Ooceraea biroi TaxID=2015173 RepID=A0A026WHK6_OOCBI|nr:hypothetical protein X777_05700 [Ooceraea biroi]
MAAQITTLKKKRSTIKAVCTRIQTYVNGVGELTLDVLANLEERKERLGHYWNEYDKIHDIQRLQYLCASLSGKAAGIIASLEMSDHNYSVVWDILKKRYDNKQTIIQTHIKSIFELPAMSRENSKELRLISDGESRHVLALQSLKRPVNSWDDILIYVISSKLDVATAKDWQATLKESQIPTFKEFVDFIAHCSQILETTLKTNVTSSKRYDTRSHSLMNAKQQSAHVTITDNKCWYYNGEHTVYKCKGFLALSVARRAAEVRKKELCLNCLRSTSHIASNCQSGNCKTCHFRHHTLLRRMQGKDDNKESEEVQTSALGKEKPEDSSQD